MTHILISIKDIEKLLLEYQKEIKEAAQSQDKTKFTKFVGKHYGLKRVYDIGKQISLDEKDVEEKAKTHFPFKGFENSNNSAKELGRIGYKQALKDLL